MVRRGCQCRRRSFFFFWSCGQVLISYLSAKIPTHKENRNNQDGSPLCKEKLSLRAVEPEVGEKSVFPHIPLSIPPIMAEDSFLHLARPLGPVSVGTAPTTAPLNVVIQPQVTLLG